MTTTIKVSDELRDRLKVQAARDGVTLGAHVARLAEADDRTHRLSDLKTAIAKTSGHSSAVYAAESAGWERTELTDLTACAIRNSRPASWRGQHSNPCEAGSTAAIDPCSWSRRRATSTPSQRY